MADLYREGETRVPVTLDPVPEDALDEIALWGARTGARGGTLTGRGLRGAVGAASRLPGDPLPRSQWPLVFRGIEGTPGGFVAPNPLKTDMGTYRLSHGPVAFGSKNPVVAATYGGLPSEEALMRASAAKAEMAHRVATGQLPESRFRDKELRAITKSIGSGRGRVSDFGRSVGARVFPMRINPESLAGEFVSDEPLGTRMTHPSWHAATSALGPGESLVARGVVDPGVWEFRPEGGVGVEDLGPNTPAGQYAWREGAAIPSGAPMRAEDVRSALVGASERVGAGHTFFPDIPTGLYERANPTWHSNPNVEAEAVKEIQDIFKGGFSGQQPPPPTIHEPSPRLAAQAKIDALHAEAADEFFEALANDPRFKPAKPPLASRIGKGLVRFAKGGLHPAGILADALLSSAAGGGGAAAGYASASPETGGTISIPSGSAILGEIPSGGVVGQETMLRAIMAADERKEALRQQYIDEINAQYGPGTVRQGAKIDEISRYLGPVAF